MKYSSSPNSECQWFARGCCAAGLGAGVVLEKWVGVPSGFEVAIVAICLVIWLACIGMSVRAKYREEGEE